MARHPVYDKPGRNATRDNPSEYRRRMGLKPGQESLRPKGGVSKFDEETLRRQLQLTYGNRSQCAKNLRCDVSTIAYGIARWNLTDFEREARASLFDEAVGHLKEALDAKQPWAIREVLRRFGRDPKRVEVSGPNGQPIQTVRLTAEQARKLSDSQIARILDGDQRALVEVVGAVGDQTRH